MSPSSDPDPDPWDVERLRLPDHLIGDRTTRRERPPRHRAGETFIKGPIPFAWIAEACHLPGSGLAVAIVARFLRGRYRHRLGWGHAEIGARLGLSPRSVRRALVEAERAGLLEVERLPGRKPRIAITTPPPRPDHPTRRHAPLRGPIPWAWWHRASHLPAPALRVAIVCWWIAGRERSAEIVLDLGAWSALNLSQPAASRGLVALESAGLVSVARRPGLSPVVTILEPTSDIMKRGESQGVG